ncbi:hypothetical protein C8R42DRAFT_651398 [Lentinula raphanica]|nr:hypothetical protein C8R42DRAFT_651398 [Lentinula raphanica]
MADWNPAPGGWRLGLAGMVLLLQGPWINLRPGTFQANRALNGERGVTCCCPSRRQRARMRQGVLGVGSTSLGSIHAPSSHGSDSDAFPVELDLFAEDSAGRFRHDLELEGGGPGPLQGRGPVPPGSPDSDVKETRNQLNRSRSASILGISIVHRTAWGRIVEMTLH